MDTCRITEELTRLAGMRAITAVGVGGWVGGVLSASSVKMMKIINERARPDSL